MARRYSESSTDSWSLVERRSSVESSDEEDGEIVTRDVYEEYDGESVGHDSMEEDTDFSESELEDEDAIEEEEQQEVSEAEEEEEEGVETIHEEEALSDSAARHFVTAEKVVERLDELADSCESPVEEALFSAIATPERMRLFVLLTLTITGAIVFGLERSLAANMSLITPQGQMSESLQAGLPSREHLSRIGVAEVREFLNRRQLQRTPPRFTDSFSAYKKAYLQRVGEMRMGGQVQGCTAGYANTSISVRTPSSSWSQAQCSRDDAPKEGQRHWTVPASIIYRNRSLIDRAGEPSLDQPIRETRRDEQLMCSLVFGPEVPPCTLNITIMPQQQPTMIRQQPKSLQQVLLPVQPKHALQPVRPNQLLMIRPQSPCMTSSSRPCKSTTQLRPTKAPRTVRPTKTQPLQPTIVAKPFAKYTSPKSPSLAVYRNYSVARVYHDRSLRRDPKPCHLPSKSVFTSKKVVEKKNVDTVLDRMKKRREQQSAAARKMNKRSVPPPVIYANESFHSPSRALMRKTSYAAGHCDRRTVKDLRPLPCISYKERLPCLAPSPRRLIGTSKTAPKATATMKKKASGSTKNWANDKTRSPKKEYIRRIPLV